MTPQANLVRRTHRLAVLLVSLLLLGACAGLPTSSLVEPGKALDAPADNEPLAVEPLGASSYDDPRQIATGFLRAQMSSHDDYVIARSYLTPTASKAWQPGSAVTIFDGESDITATRPDTHTVRLGVQVVGSISTDGHLVHTSTPTRRTVEFHVSRGPQGWRIDRLTPDSAVWISDADVPRLFTSETVYYPPTVGTALVPDLRWLPRQGLATALARAALSPPPSWLQPAVAPAMPDGTQLAVDAVPVRRGSAEVSLTPAAARADNRARTRLWAALTATIMQAPEVRAVTIKVGASRLETDNLPASVTAPDQVGYSVVGSPVAAVVSRAKTYLAWTDANAVDAVSGTDAAAAAGRPKLPAIPADWSLLAVGQGGRQIAAVSPDHTSVRRWLNGTSVTVSSLGADLVRPTFDSSGWLWVAGHRFSDVPATAGGQAKPASPAGEKQGPLWVLDTSGGSDAAATSSIRVPWLGGGSIDSVAISPEGARVALTIHDGDRRRAVIAAVVRDADGKPVSLGPAHDVAAGVGDVRDVVWADATSVAVLGSVGGHLQPAVQTIDDVVTPLGEVAGATGLVSSFNGTNGLFVRTAADAVYSRLGSSWSSFVSHGDIIVPRS